MRTMIRMAAAAGLGLALLLGTTGIATAQAQCTPLFPGSSLCQETVVEPPTTVIGVLNPGSNTLPGAFK